jgi:transcription elongation factor Elf1
MSTPKKPDCEYQNDATCPHCGYVVRDSWEINFQNSGGEVEMTCGECEKDFIVWRQIQVTYSTRPKEELP